MKPSRDEKLRTVVTRAAPELDLLKDVVPGDAEDLVQALALKLVRAAEDADINKELTDSIEQRLKVEVEEKKATIVTYQDRVLKLSKELTTFQRQVKEWEAKAAVLGPQWERLTGDTNLHSTDPQAKIYKLAREVEEYSRARFNWELEVKRLDRELATARTHSEAREGLLQNWTQKLLAVRAENEALRKQNADHTESIWGLNEKLEATICELKESKAKRHDLEIQAAKHRGLLSEANDRVYKMDKSCKEAHRKAQEADDKRKEVELALENSTFHMRNLQDTYQKTNKDRESLLQRLTVSLTRNETIETKANLLDTKVGHRDRQLVISDSNYQDSRNYVTTLMAKLADSERRLRASQADLASLHQGLDTATKNTTAARASLAAAEDQAASLRKELRGVRSELEASRSRQAELAAETQQATVRLEQSHSDKKELGRTGNHLASELKRSEAQLAEAGRKVLEQSSNANKLSGEWSASTADLKASRVEVARLTGELTDSNAQLRDVRAQVAELQADLQQVSSDLIAARGDERDKRAAVVKLTRDMRSEQVELEHSAVNAQQLQGDVSQLLQALEATEQKVKAQEKRANDLQAALDASHVELKLSAAQVETWKHEAKKVEGELVRVKDHDRWLRHDIQQKRDDVSKTTESMMAAKEGIHGLMGVNAGLKQDLDAAEVRYKKAEAQNEELIREVTTMKSRIQTLEYTAGESKTFISKLEDKLENAKNSLRWGAAGVYGRELEADLNESRRAHKKDTSDTALMQSSLENMMNEVRDHEQKIAAERAHREALERDLHETKEALAKEKEARGWDQRAAAVLRGELDGTKARAKAVESRSMQLARELRTSTQRCDEITQDRAALMEDVAAYKSLDSSRKVMSCSALVSLPKVVEPSKPLLARRIPRGVFGSSDY